MTSGCMPLEQAAPRRRLRIGATQISRSATAGIGALAIAAGALAAGLPGSFGHGRDGQGERDAGDVLSLRRTRAGRCGILFISAAQQSGEATGRDGVWAVAQDRDELAALFSRDLLAGGFTVTIAAGALAVRAVQSFAGGGERVLFWSTCSRRSPIRAGPCGSGKRFGLINTMVFKTLSRRASASIVVAFSWDPRW